MDEKTKTAAGIAAGLQGMKYDDKRLAVRKAAAARLTFDDDPAAFASVMAKEARS